MQKKSEQKSYSLWQIFIKSIDLRQSPKRNKSCIKLFKLHRCTPDYRQITEMASGIALVEDERRKREILWLAADKYGNIEPTNCRAD